MAGGKARHIPRYCDYLTLKQDDMWSGRNRPDGADLALKRGEITKLRR
jgi:hypothetical protein